MSILQISRAVGSPDSETTVNAARKFYPNIPPGDETYEPEKATHLTTFDTSKADRLLGLKYLSLDESTHDIIEQFKGKGWI